MANKSKPADATVQTVQKYGKEQIVLAKRYAGKQDLLNAILKDGQFHSFEQVDELIEKFMKGKVK